MTSTSSFNPKCSALPRPCLPKTPVACASSTMIRAPYLRATLTSSGNLAMWPLIENTPSVTINRPPGLSLSFSSSRSKSATSLCSYLRSAANDSRAPS